MWARAAKPLWLARLRPGGGRGGPEGASAKMSNGPQAQGPVSPMALAHAAPRCAARRTFDGGSCQQPAMANGRCRMHGGKSTGPRTAEGLERCRKARWKHGYYSAADKAARQQARMIRWALRRLVDSL